MSSSEDQTLAVHQPDTALARPSDLLQVISQAVIDPRVDVDKMERLLAMHERIVAEERKAVFIAALARVQARCPQIARHGQIIVKGVLRSKFAKLEDVDSAIRPLLSEEGFAFTFDAQSTDAKIYLISCRLSHAAGHSETKTLLLPVDASDFRSPVQSVASTMSFGRRQLIKAHLNIVERDEDTDGVSLERISEEQVRDLTVMLKDLQADIPKFCGYMGVPSLDAILVRDYPRAITAIQAKQRQPK